MDVEVEVLPMVQICKRSVYVRTPTSWTVRFLTLYSVNCRCSMRVTERSYPTSHGSLFSPGQYCSHLFCVCVCVCVCVCAACACVWARRYSISLLICAWTVLISCTEQQVPTGLCCIHKRVPSAVLIRSLFLAQSPLAQTANEGIFLRYFGRLSLLGIADTELLWPSFYGWGDTVQAHVA